MSKKMIMILTLVYLFTIIIIIIIILSQRGPGYIYSKANVCIFKILRFDGEIPGMISVSICHGNYLTFIFFFFFFFFFFFGDTCRISGPGNLHENSFLRPTGGLFNLQYFLYNGKYL